MGAGSQPWRNHHLGFLTYEMKTTGAASLEGTMRVRGDEDRVPYCVSECCFLAPTLFPRGNGLLHSTVVLGAYQGRTTAAPPGGEEQPQVRPAGVISRDV